jgi:hypothetical protein
MQPCSLDTCEIIATTVPYKFYAPLDSFPPLLTTNPLLQALVLHPALHVPHESSTTLPVPPARDSKMSFVQSIADAANEFVALARQSKPGTVSIILLAFLMGIGALVRPMQPIS